MDILARTSVAKTHFQQDLNMPANVVIDTMMYNLPKNVMYLFVCCNIVIRLSVRSQQRKKKYLYNDRIQYLSQMRVGSHECEIHSNVRGMYTVVTPNTTLYTNCYCVDYFGNVRP